MPLKICIPLLGPADAEAGPGAWSTSSLALSTAFAFLPFPFPLALWQSSLLSSRTSIEEVANDAEDAVVAPLSGKIDRVPALLLLSRWKGTFLEMGITTPHSQFRQFSLGLLEALSLTKRPLI